MFFLSSQKLVFSLLFLFLRLFYSQRRRSCRPSIIVQDEISLSKFWQAMKSRSHLESLRSWLVVRGDCSLAVAAREGPFSLSLSFFILFFFLWSESVCSSGHKPQSTPFLLFLPLHHLLLLAGANSFRICKCLPAGLTDIH